MGISVRVLAATSLVALFGAGMVVLAQPLAMTLSNPSAVDRVIVPPLAERVWDYTVPGATPRPGASITGPIRIDGVMALSQVDDWFAPGSDSAEPVAAEPAQGEASVEPVQQVASAKPAVPAANTLAGKQPEKQPALLAGDILLERGY